MCLMEAKLQGKVPKVGAGLEVICHAVAVLEEVRSDSKAEVGGARRDRPVLLRAPVRPA